MIRKVCFFGPKKMRFIIQTKNRSEPAKNRFSVALIRGQGHSLTLVQGHSDSHFQTSFP